MVVRRRRDGRGTWRPRAREGDAAGAGPHGGAGTVPCGNVGGGGAWRPAMQVGGMRRQLGFSSND